MLRDQFNNWNKNKTIKSCQKIECFFFSGLASYKLAKRSFETLVMWTLTGISPLFLRCSRLVQCEPSLSMKTHQDSWTLLYLLLKSRLHLLEPSLSSCIPPSLTYSRLLILFLSLTPPNSFVSTCLHSASHWCRLHQQCEIVSTFLQVTFSSSKIFRLFHLLVCKVASSHWWGGVRSCSTDRRVEVSM